MDNKRGGITETENGDAFLELNRITTKYPHRYTKVSALPFPLKVVCGAVGRRSGAGGGRPLPEGSGKVKAEIAWIRMCKML